MPRRYTRKLGSREYKNYTEETLSRCLAAIQNKELSHRKASLEFGIPRRTILNKLKGYHVLNPGVPPIFTEHEENIFVNCIIKASDYGFPMGEFDLKMVVKHYLEQIGRVVKKFKSNVPGHDWILNFLKRHPQLTKRFADNIKKSRAGITKNDLRQYISFLSKELEGVPPTNIFNFDETNLVDDPGKKKVFARRGTKYLEHIRTTSKAGTSIMFCGSASGKLLPLFVLYKSRHIWSTWTEGGPPGTRYSNSTSGWFDSASFLEWFESILIPETRRLDGKKIVICDNVAFHFSPKVLELSETNNITFICLPPNSTHITQPLDVAVFRSVKGSWRKLLGEWKENNGNNLVTKEIMPTLLGRLLVEINPTIKNNLKSGFQACGIFPCDVEVLLKKIPGQDDDVQSTIESSFVTCLEKKRAEWTEKKPGGKRKKINVPPGKSITTADLTSEPSTSTAAHPQDRIIYQDESEDEEDWETYRQRCLAEDKEIEEIMTVQETSTPGFKPIVKSISSYCIVTYKNKFYPGVILELSDDTAKIKSMKKSNSYWKWPEVPDVLEYEWKDVVGGINEPIKISKTRNIYRVPELSNIY